MLAFKPRRLAGEIIQEQVGQQKWREMVHAKIRLEAVARLSPLVREDAGVVERHIKLRNVSPDLRCQLVNVGAMRSRR